MNLNFILTNNIPKHLSLWMKCRAGWDRRTTRSSCLHVFKHVTVGNLSNNGGDGIENGKKAIDLDWQNNNFGRASRLFCTFLCNRCTTATWNFLISLFWRTWAQENDCLLFFLNFDYEVHLVSEKFSNIWRIEQDTINTMKPEAVRIHFWSDVFVTVAVLVA